MSRNLRPERPDSRNANKGDSPTAFSRYKCQDRARTLVTEEQVVHDRARCTVDPGDGRLQTSGTHHLFSVVGDELLVLLGDKPAKLRVISVKVMLSGSLSQARIGPRATIEADSEDPNLEVSVYQPRAGT